MGLIDSKQAQRHYERVFATRNNCDFDDLRRLLEAVGYTVRQPRRGGSHYIFKRGSSTITVPRARPVKRQYVNAVLEIIEEGQP
jgi:predicted RNA binding protein YcfA (HicA-like mRNA interferase family)